MNTLIAGFSKVNFTTLNRDLTLIWRNALASPSVDVLRTLSNIKSQTKATLA